MRYFELVLGTPEVLYSCLAALVVVGAIAVLIIVRLGRRGEGARLAELADSEVGPAAGGETSEDDEPATVRGEDSVVDGLLAEQEPAAEVEHRALAADVEADVEAGVEAGVEGAARADVPGAAAVGPVSDDAAASALPRTGPEAPAAVAVQRSDDWWVFRV